MTDRPLTRALMREIRAGRNAFLDFVESIRPDLYRYCRALTGDPWDAEDLAQEALLRAHGRLATLSLQHEIERPKAYLFRIATHAWIDEVRRAGRRVDLPDADLRAAPESPPVADVHDAMTRIARVLAPREAAVVLLKDVFDFTLEEAAGFLETTVGAVKAALHRGRVKLREAEGREPPLVGRRHAAGDARVDAFVDAFNARDLDRLMALFSPDATAEIVGVLREEGRDVVRDGSMLHTLFEGDTPLPEGSPGAEPAVVGSRPLVVLWYRVEEEGEPRSAVRDVLHLRWAEDRIEHLRYDYYSPEVLHETGAALGVPVRDNGYRYRPDGT